jgi:crotonobetainyl-CoA:carnitine CoA-transferase CaiB-like acyl-CoA transferase
MNGVALIGALDGVRVLDLSGPLACYGSKVLADLGADVIKVEPPGGDPMRRRPPFKDDKANLEGSLWFGYYNENKRGITLDLTRAEAGPLLVELATAADVAVVSPDPAWPNRWDARWQEWSNGELVLCSLTPYGLTGPYRNVRATHFTSQAMGGVMVSPGSGQAPLPIPDQQEYDLAATHAAVAVLVALRCRPVVHGQLIDISVHEVVGAGGHSLQRFGLSGSRELQGTGMAVPPAGTWACADGEIEFQVWDPRHWTGFVQLLDNPPEFADPALADLRHRGQHVEMVRRVTGTLLADRKKEELVERAQALGVPCAAVNQPAEFVFDPQTEARGFFPWVTHPYLGQYRAPGVFFRSDQPLAARRRPAPLLGEHNQQVYVDQLGHDIAEVEEWKGAGLV